MSSEDDPQNSSQLVEAESTPAPLQLVELNVEARTILAFNAPGVGKLLPSGWQPITAEAGPFKGANLLIIFSDRQFVQAEGETPPPAAEANQLAVVGVLVPPPEPGKAGVMVLFGLSAKPEGAPGPYGVFSLADASVDRVLRSGPGDVSKAAEQWELNTGSGLDDEKREQLSLWLNYERRVPTRVADSMTRVYSAQNPSFYREYKADQGVIVMRKGANGLDGISDIRFRAEGPKLGEIFEGFKSPLDCLISVVSQPWTVRQVFMTG